jgi:hypothetical protein
VKRILLVLGIAVVVTVLLGVSQRWNRQAFADRSQQQTTVSPPERTATAMTLNRPTPLPTFIPAEGSIPAPTPPDDREIAVLSLSVISNADGAVESVQLEQARIVRSYAPSVLLLTGEWKVELIGRDSVLSYGIQDPRRVEIALDSEDESDPPFVNVMNLDLSWELVVPLYDGPDDLQVTEINIYDVSGDLIFSRRVDREGWSTD